jgi:hypothetical protein
MLWWQGGTHLLQLPVLTQLFPVCLQEGSHQMSQELEWLYDLQFPAVEVLPCSAFSCDKSLPIVPETYQDNLAHQSQRCAATWMLSDLRLIFKMRKRLTVLCSLIKVPYAIKIKCEVITMLHVVSLCFNIIPHAHDVFVSPWHKFKSSVQWT